MHKIVTLTDGNFDEIVLKNDKLVFVDFWAPWCGPCKALIPTLEELSIEYDGKVVFCKLNVDDSPNIAADYNIRSIPTILMFKNGDIVESVQGALPKEQFKKAIDGLI